MIPAAVNEDVTKELQKAWEAFCKDLQFGVAPGLGTFSIIPHFVGDDKIRVYIDCGFTESQFEQVDWLLVKIEQLCLLSIVSAFEKFRSQQVPRMDISAGEKDMEPTLATRKSSSHEGEKSEMLNSFGEGEKTEMPHSEIGVGVKAERDSVSIKGESERVEEDKNTTMDKTVKKQKVKKLPAVDVDSLDMGRGKRKKFAKVQFDLLEDVRSPTVKKEVFTRCNEKDKISQSVKNNKVASGRKRSAEKNSEEESTNFPKRKKLKSVVEPEKNFSLSTEKDEKLEQAIEGEDVKDKKKASLTDKEDDRTDPGTVKTKNEVPVETEKKTGVSQPDKVSIITDEREKNRSTKENIKDCDSQSEEGEVNSRTKKKEAAGERTNFDCDDEAPIICSLCKEKVPKSRDLFKHWKQVHKPDHDTLGKDEAPPNLFYCEVCHESFPSPRRFKLHYRIHSGARPHSCKVCGKGFRIYKGLVDHMMCHSKERPHACSQCPKTFISKKLLNKHVKAHNNEIVPRVCEMCGKQYRTALGLKLHYRVHAGVRPHKCDVCGMAFTQRCSLQIHKRLHTGDKRHVCDICGWRFNTNTALVTHTRVHTREKPYKCSQCPFRAASSSCLRDHEIVHSKEKPYPCVAPNCHKSFKRQAHLICHLKKKHAGLKPYQCQLCAAKFAMVSELMHHQKSDACEGGRIKRELSPEPIHLAPTESIIQLESPGQQGQHTLVVLEGASGVGQDSGLQIYREPKARPLAVPEQEVQVASLTEVPGEDHIVIHIVTEPGAEGGEVVLSEEEMAAIIRLSQQM